jgi:hypothetical protein
MDLMGIHVNGKVKAENCPELFFPLKKSANFTAQLIGNTAADLQTNSLVIMRANWSNICC